MHHRVFCSSELRDCAESSKERGAHGWMVIWNERKGVDSKRKYSTEAVVTVLL